MCGIVGIFNLDGKKVNTVILKSMNDKIQHRGPDSEGYFVENNVGLANRRLSIIDLKTGDQPIFNEDQSVVIVYNGEIYNFKEITEILKKKGHIFRTKSDTETIVHAYEEYGCNCVTLFNGMFAFAIWDKTKKQLFLARDRLGIKPLYYYLNDKKIIFSSEIKAIIQDNSIERQIDIHGLSDYLMFQNILDDKTFFKGIKKLLPGDYLLCSKNRFSIFKYWDFKFKPVNGKSIFFEEEYKKTIKQSVKEHLLSDVPVGCYLSGGFDSGSVATFASREIKNSLNTFTGYFDEGNKYSEFYTAKEVAESINAKRFSVAITPIDFIDNICDIVYHLDEPTTGTGSFPQYMVSKLVSKHVKVVLTGHGGDELFCGYQVFKSIYYKELIKKNPLNIFKLFYGIKPSELTRVMYYFFYPHFIDSSTRYGLFIMFNKKEQRKLFTTEFYDQIKNYNPLDVIEKLIEDRCFNNFERTKYLYLKTYLPTLFILEDKVGMAHSVEARTPICGNSVVDFALSVPIDESMKGNMLKSLTKRSMRGILPKCVYKQPKMGFPTPLARWFKGPLKKFAYDTLLSEQTRKRNIFKLDYIKTLLDACANSKTDNLYDYARANKIFSLITIELWFRIFIEGKYEN